MGTRRVAFPATRLGVASGLLGLALGACSSSSPPPPPPPACASGNNCVSATLSGAVHGTMTTEATPPGNFRPICTTVSTKPAQWVAHVFGKVGHQDWLIAVQVSGYTGPGTYKAGVTLGTLSSTGTGGNTYFGTLSTTVATAQDSATVSGTLQPQRFTGHNVTMHGSLSCTALTPQR